MSTTIKAAIFLAVSGAIIVAAAWKVASWLQEQEPPNTRPSLYEDHTTLYLSTIPPGAAKYGIDYIYIGKRGPFKHVVIKHCDGEEQVIDLRCEK